MPQKKGKFSNNQYSLDLQDCYEVITPTKSIIRTFGLLNATFQQNLHVF